MIEEHNVTPLKQSAEYIWINGELVPWQEAKIHVLTHSLHYSGAVFEGEKSYNGKIFKLIEHTNRLIESARTLNIQIPYSFNNIIDAHHLLIEKNNIKNAYVRPLIWYGSESITLTSKALSVNLLIATIPSITRSMNGLNIHIGHWRKAPPNAMPPQCKSSGHYNMMILCQKEAQSLGYDDALLLDWRGYIAECTTSNIFFVKDNKLFTPIADAFLNGITRLTVIELAKQLKLEVQEEYITIEKLKLFDECFITGTAIEIKNIKSIDLGNQKITYKLNKITTLLQKEYNHLVHK